MTEWLWTTIDQIGKIVTGKTPPTSQHENYGGDIPFVTPTDMDGRRTIDKTGRYLSTKGARMVDSAKVPAGAVLVSCIGSDMGKSAIAAHDCVTNQQINSVIVDGSVNRLFVYYNISMRQQEIKGAASGSAQPILKKSAFGRLPISLPPLETQYAIASVLGALDDKIELNERMNETLEAMARAIFKDWFVDFGPVRAKMEGIEPYLSREIWELFPDRLDDEAKPEGWKRYRFNELADIANSSINPSRHADEVFEHYSLPAFDAAQEPVFARGDEIKSNKTLIPKGAVLLSKLNPRLPRVWLPFEKRRSRQIASTEFLVTVPHDGISQCLLYSLFLESGFRTILRGMVTGTSTSHQRVSPKALKNTEVFIGEQRLIQKFEEITDSIFERILQNRREEAALKNMRDLLLPKLISGEITVDDAKRKIEEAV